MTRSDTRPKKSHLGAWLLVGGAALSAALAYGLYRRPDLLAELKSHSTTHPATQPATLPARSIPVLASPAREGDLPVYVQGLGTVTALNMVVIRSRVDGQLMSLAFQEGQLIHEGELLAQIDPRPFQVQLTQAQGQLARDDALLNNARADLQRFELARETISRQQLDTAASQVAQYLGAVKSDQGLIDSAQLQLTYCRITSPITGRVGLRSVDPGNMVRASDAAGLAVVTQIQPISVLFNLPEDNLPEILKAMKAAETLGVDVSSRDLKTTLATGRLQAIDNQIDPTTATVRLRAVFANEDQSLFPNQFVNVRLLLKTLRKVTLVASAAVQRSPQTTFVYVVKADQSVEMRPVVVGLSEGSATVITQGLSPGEIVVTDGVDKLQPGLLVSVRTPTTMRRGR